MHPISVSSFTTIWLHQLYSSTSLSTVMTHDIASMFIFSVSFHSLRHFCAVIGSLMIDLYFYSLCFAHFLMFQISPVSHLLFSTILFLSLLRLLSSSFIIHFSSINPPSHVDLSVWQQQRRSWLWFEWFRSLASLLRLTACCSCRPVHQAGRWQAWWSALFHNATPQRCVGTWATFALLLAPG